MSEFFNISDFKKWMEDQQDTPQHSPFIGVYVESKLSAHRLIKKAEIENDDPLEGVVIDFVENGGTVMDVNGHWFTIHTDSGTFTVPRMYVRRA